MQGTPTFKANLRDISVTIAAAGSNSTSIPTRGAGGGSYQIPAAFTGATVTIQYSNDDTNWTAVPALTDENNPETVSANGTYVLPANAFNARHIRIVSAGVEAAARTIALYLRG